MFRMDYADRVIRRLTTSALGALIMGSMALSAQDRSASSIHDRIAALARQHEADLISLRRDLHRHPELSGQEVRTSRIVAERLRALGLDVQAGIAGTGVVGILTGGKPGPLIAYRADMDAVPSTDPDPADFRSETPGVRHICGHDLHVTIGVGLATVLAAVKSSLSGSVMFVFQPAEERATGAKAMLKAGVFEKRKPVAIYGLHTSPMAVGRIGTRGGRMMNPNAIATGAVNDDALAARAKADLIAVLGADAFIAIGEPPARFSEDFGDFQAVVPGVFFFLGASNQARGWNAMPHTPDFMLDEAAITFGIRAIAAVIVR